MLPGCHSRLLPSGSWRLATSGVLLAASQHAADSTGSQAAQLRGLRDPAEEIPKTADRFGGGCVLRRGSTLGFGEQFFASAARGVAAPLSESGCMVIVGEGALDQPLAVLAGGVAGRLGLVGAADRVRPGCSSSWHT
jgi:hypothetical protein